MKVKMVNLIRDKRTVISVIALAVLGVLLASGQLVAGRGGVGTEESVRGKLDPFAIRSDGHSILSDVAAKVSPAVVFIRTERSLGEREERDERYSPFEFFRDLIPEQESHPKIPGGGSGFFIDNEGRILTNYHVIKDADKITVVVGQNPEAEEYPAEVVGYDWHTDIAIVQIKSDIDYEIVPLGDSDEMLVGDWVMAIGTPFGELAGTVTLGIVSAKGRSDLRIVGGVADYQNYIQTDASINFGNSGGPLVNLRGEAIGINTAINPTGQGIGFAIPINMAKRNIDQLITKGSVQYGFIGIAFEELTKTLAKGLGLDIERGVLVKEVRENTPAARAGLRHNDVIVEYDGKPVREGQSFRLMVGNTAVGTRVPIAIVRGKERKEMTIEISERPDEQVVAAAKPTANSWLGLQVDDISSAGVRERLGRIDSKETGVVVLG
ncbi:MAG: trypsin-like peptidase domain-containing protein, partial [Candidatus Latescibacterota bacterium]